MGGLITGSEEINVSEKWYSHDKQRLRVLTNVCLRSLTLLPCAYTLSATGFTKRDFFFPKVMNLILNVSTKYKITHSVVLLTVKRFYTCSLCTMGIISMGTGTKGGGVPDCTSHWIWLAEGVKSTFFFFCTLWWMTIKYIYAGDPRMANWVPKAKLQRKVKWKATCAQRSDAFRGAGRVGVRKRKKNGIHSWILV